MKEESRDCTINVNRIYGDVVVYVVCEEHTMLQLCSSSIVRSTWISRHLPGSLMAAELPVVPARVGKLRYRVSPSLGLRKRSRELSTRRRCSRALNRWEDLTGQWLHLRVR